MTIAVGEVVQVRLEGIIEPSATRWQNVFYLQCQDTHTGADYTILTALCTYIQTRWNATLQDYQSEDVKLTVIRAQRIAPTRSVFVAISVDIAGGATGNIGQPDAAIVCTLRTNYSGRRKTGRFYFGGFTDALEEEGLVASGTYPSLLGSFADFFTAAWVPDDAVYVTTVWSETEYAVTNDVALASTPVARIDVDRIVRRQTRRDWKGRQGTVV